MKYLVSPRPFWLNLLLILALVTLVGVIGFLLTQQTTFISNTYFFGTLVLWVIATIPAFTETGGNFKIRLDARKTGQNAKELIRAQEEKYQRGGRVTFLFGLAGFLCFILAFLTLSL